MQRRIRPTGVVNLPLDFLGKKLCISVAGVKFYRLAKVAGGGAYVNLTKKNGGKIAIIDTTGLFDPEELKKKRENGEYLNKTEQNILIDYLSDAKEAI